jgi:hypothetical protein
MTGPGKYHKRANIGHNVAILGVVVLRLQISAASECASDGVIRGSDCQTPDSEYGSGEFTQTPIVAELAGLRRQAVSVRIWCAAQAGERHLLMVSATDRALIPARRWLHSEFTVMVTP